jgi:hypothetical protein
MRTLFLIIILVFICVAGLSIAAAGQNRDYFTDEEIEKVRDAQAIDERIEVLVHCIDRRFAVLKTGSGGLPPTNEKDKWGPLPTGTKTQILADVKNILQKAIDDIDNLAERPDSAPLPSDPKEKRKKNQVDLFPKAVRFLAAAAKRLGTALKIELDVSKDQQEKGIIMDSIDMCDEIIASVSKLKS